MCVSTVYSILFKDTGHYWSLKLRDNIERKNILVTWSCVLSDAWFWDLGFRIWGLKVKFIEKYFFLEIYFTSEGAVSHNVLYYQPLPITHNQESFYDNNYFECLPIVSTALKHCILSTFPEFCENKSTGKSRSFRVRGNFPRISFRDLRFRIWGLEIKHLKAHNLAWPWCDKGVFSFINISQLWRPISSNFHRFVILCICWDTPTVKTILWQLPIVSSVFNNIGVTVNRNVFLNPCCHTNIY